MDDIIPENIPQSKPNPDTTFIYALTDPRTNEIRYIGKSNDPQHRLKAHLRSTKETTYKSRWIKHLKSLDLKPILSILEEVPIDKWQEREMYWIQYYHSQDAPLTNGTDGGDGMTSPSPELREKLSLARKGKKRPDVSAALTGRKRPPGAAAKAAASNKGKPLTEERKANISASKKGKKQPNVSTSMVGRKLAPESIAKRSAAIRGSKRPPEVKAKISAAHTGKKREPFSEEWRRKLGDASRGRKHTPEARERMSLARKKWHAMRNSPPESPTLWSDHSA